MYFHVRCAELGPWTVVHVVGEIDLATAPRFRSELAVAAQRAHALAVDLTECDLIDSVGLGIVIGGARRLRVAGGRFAVVATGSVRQTFERTRLDEIIDVAPTIDELPTESPAEFPTDERSASPS